MVIVWSALVLLCLLMYVVLDGYDLGIGIGMLFERDAVHRREMLEQIVVAWDGNETWLVLLGVCLWAGFPLAFGTVLPHAFLGLTVVLFALIVRGVAVELASQAPPAPVWSRAFAVASLVAALAQGATIATLARDLPIRDGAYAGTAFGGYGWFNVLAAITLACLYATLGHAYLKARTTGALRAATGRRGFVAALLAGGLVAASLLAVNDTAAPLDLHSPGRAVGFAGLLAMAAAGWVLTLVTMRPGSRGDALPFAGTATLVVALAAAVVVARAPVIAPPALTVAGSVSPSTTMQFLAVGVGLNVPLVLFYNWFTHHSLRVTRDNAAPEAEGAIGVQP